MLSYIDGIRNIQLAALLQIFLTPIDHHEQERLQFTPKGCQRVLDSGWHLLIALAVDQAIALQYTSGSMVTGDTGDRMTDETAPLETQGIVAWRGQHEVITLAGAQRGVRAIVVRPASIVYGPGRGGAIPRLLQSAREQGTIPYIGDGNNKKTPVHVNDLASLYVLALEQANAGEVFIGAEEEIVTQKQVAEAVSRASGVDARLVSVPYDEALKTMGFLAYIQALNSVVSGAKARRVLGWNPTGPTLMDELDHGYYRHA